jgi:septal ring factor EnvC (AmiA/AmiB activator)
MTNVHNEAIPALPTRFTPKAQKLYEGITGKEESARKQAIAAYDQMDSDGMLWTDFLSPKSKGSTASVELYETLKTARRKGFGAWAQKLYEKKAETKDKQEKKNKLRTDLSRKMAADRDAMRLRQDPEFKASKSAASRRAPQQPTGQAKAAGSAAKVLESLQQAAKRAQAIEAPDFDVVELVALLAKAQQIVVKH